MNSTKSVVYLKAVGKARALAPIAHSAPPVKGKKNNILYFRRLPVVYTTTTETGETTPDVVIVPVISGNSIRGIGRELLFNQTIKALDLDRNFSSIGLPESQSVYVAFLLAKGGHAPEKCKPINAKIGVYTKIRKAIPMLSLLGGVYMGHHFESGLLCGFMYPVLRETVKAGLIPWLAEDKAFEYESAEEILNCRSSNAEVTAQFDVVSIQRFAKTNNKHYDEIEDLVSEDRKAAASPSEDKDTETRKDSPLSIFGVEVLPPGIELAHSVGLQTEPDDVGCVLAYKAYLALLAERAHVGGMGARGFGSVALRYSIEDGGNTEELGPQHVGDYVAYCADHRDEIIDALKSIPGAFQHTFASKEPKEKNGGDRKRAGGKASHDADDAGEDTVS